MSGQRFSDNLSCLPGSTAKRDWDAARQDILLPGGDKIGSCRFQRLYRLGGNPEWQWRPASSGLQVDWHRNRVQERMPVCPQTTIVDERASIVVDGFAFDSVNYPATVKRDDLCAGIPIECGDFIIGARKVYPA